MYLWSQRQSYRATVRPQLVTTEGKTLPLTPTGTKEAEDAARLAPMHLTLADRLRPIDLLSIQASAMADIDDHSVLGRGRMTNTKRIELLQRDRAQQSRVLTALIDGSKSFTPEQMAQLRSILTDVLATPGRVSMRPISKTTREDFRFLRRMRLTWDGTVRRLVQRFCSASSLPLQVSSAAA